MNCLNELKQYLRTKLTTKIHQQILRFNQHVFDLAEFNRDFFWNHRENFPFSSHRTNRKMEKKIFFSQQSHKVLRLFPKLPFSFITFDIFTLSLSFVRHDNVSQNPNNEEGKFICNMLRRIHKWFERETLFAIFKAKTAFSLLFTANRWSGSFHDSIAWKEFLTHLFILRDNWVETVFLTSWFFFVNFLLDFFDRECDFD
jgi:hypothetical protein